MSNYVLYGGGLTLGIGPQMVLDELSIPYQLEVVDILKSEQFDQSYLAMNPAGFIPTLICPDETILTEAAAIMLYLVDKYAYGSLAPKIHNDKRGLFLSRLWYITNDLQPAIKIYYYPQRYTTNQAEVGNVKEQSRIIAYNRWQIVNDHYLADSDYLLGDHITIADYLLAIFAAYGMISDSDIFDNFPKVGQHYNLLCQRPACGPLLQKINREMREFTKLRESL